MFDYRQVTLRPPMALESNTWITSNAASGANRDQQQQQSHQQQQPPPPPPATQGQPQSQSSQSQPPAPQPQQQHTGVVKCEESMNRVTQHNQNFVTQDDVNQSQRGLLKIPNSVGKISMFTQTEQTNRFTQTEHSSRYGGNCLETSLNPVSCKTEPTTMFDPSGMQQQQQQQQEQQQQQQSSNTTMYSGNDKNKETDKSGNNPTEFPFCYNVNMLQKVNQQGSVGVPVGGLGGDDKGCYRFDVTQPFSYNYALVNQMSLAAAASTATFKCDVCGLVFTHLSLLNHHKRIHNTANVSSTGTQSPNASERQYICDMCGISFTLPGDLKSHKNGVHNKSNPIQNHQHSQVKCCDCGVELGCEHQSATSTSGKGKKGGKFVKCESCQEINAASVGNSGTTPAPSYSGANTQTAETGLNKVQNNSPGVIAIKPGHHPVKRRGIASVTKCHKCNGSGIIFIGGTRNNAGIEKPFHCNVCDGTFSRYSSLWSHKRLHSGDKPFKCEICGLAFARAAYLKNHGRVHTGEKPFKCAVCGMQFSQSPHLKNHERIHSGERPYQCEVCDKTFARHSTLWNHRRIHTGEKPYRCDVCGSAFNQATHLKNHAKVHTGEKPHRCDICDVGFSDRFALKRHRSIHEKYGRTTASNTNGSSVSTTQNNNQGTPSNSNTVSNVNVNASTNTNTSSNSNPNPQSSMDEMYKCEVGGPIAFPGCSRPHDEKQ